MCLILISSTFLNKNAYTQNLIQNESFENYTNIDCTYGGLDNGNPPYNHIVDNWYGYQTPDYFNSICSTTGWFNMPNNYFGFNYSKNGNAFVGIGIYEKGGYGKEYIYQHLTQPLQSGKVYCLSFYINRADRFTYAIKNIGALFSNNLPSLTNGYEINAIPQVGNQTIIISDTTNWTQIQGCFTANGSEQYVIIGNFTTNYNTDTLNTNSTNLVPGREGTSYYYIDDVTLIDQTTVSVNELNVSTKISLYPNPAKDVLNIDLGTLKEDTKINIYNAFGELVLTEHLTTQNSSLKTHHLLSGIYFYRILVRDKIVKTDKIVIIK